VKRFSQTVIDGRNDSSKEIGIMATKKLSYEEFVLKAIDALHTEKSKGIHSVYSGHNNAFRKYFDGDDPVAVVKGLEAKGTIKVRPCKGGVMIYKPADFPQTGDNTKATLKKMNLG